MIGNLPLHKKNAEEWEKTIGVSRPEARRDAIATTSQFSEGGYVESTVDIAVWEKGLPFSITDCEGGDESGSN